MIAIINYGLGNLHSVRKAVAYVGGEAEVTDDADLMLKAEKIILPGVGAFSDGMTGLDSRGLVSVLKQVIALGKPLLGICLGMQLLFDESHEQGMHQGLGLLPGKVTAFTQPEIKVPQIGWNQITISKPSNLMDGIRDGDYFYFNHSYYCVPDDERDVLTITEYGTQFASSIERGKIFGVQFHPEKSQTSGLRILRNFVEL